MDFVLSFISTESFSDFAFTFPMLSCGFQKWMGRSFLPGFNVSCFITGPDVSFLCSLSFVCRRFLSPLCWYFMRSIYNLLKFWPSVVLQALSLPLDFGKKFSFDLIDFFAGYHLKHIVECVLRLLVSPSYELRISGHLMQIMSLISESLPHIWLATGSQYRFLLFLFLLHWYGRDGPQIHLSISSQTNKN